MLYHFAYTFDCDQFHTELISKITRHGEVDVYRLQQQAKVVVQNASKETKQILDYLKFDNDWLEDPEKDASQANRWYIINLANVFSACPSLSNNRFHGSHYVLEKILPLAGWTYEEILEIVHGKPISSLLADSKYQILLDTISQYGYLSVQDVQAILSRLESSKTHFSNPSSVSQTLMKEYSEYNQLTPAVVLSMAYADAVDMLQTALSRKAALYLLRDF